jgi:hypothetical protein
MPNKGTTTTTKSITDFVAVVVPLFGTDLFLCELLILLL